MFLLCDKSYNELLTHTMQIEKKFVEPINRKSITINRHFVIANQILNCPFYGTLFVPGG